MKVCLINDRLIIKCNGIKVTLKLLRKITHSLEYNLNIYEFCYKHLKTYGRIIMVQMKLIKSIFNHFESIYTPSNPLGT